MASQFDQLVSINPHWAPVIGGNKGPDADPILVHGIAHGSHGDVGGDFPSDHGASDSTVSLELDDSDRGFLASGNGSGASARLELEWESDAWPAWAWPGEGDRVVAMGRWIFDCGHDGAQPGHCSATAAQSCTIDDDCRAPACPHCANGESCTGARFGYLTEIHPPYATATIRQGRGALLTAGPDATGQPATRVDLFVGANGGGAGDRCMQTHQDPLIDLVFSEDCYPLAQPLAPLNRFDFAFDVPLPPRPSASAQPVWRAEPRADSVAVPANYDVTPHADDPQPHLSVVVWLTEPVAGRLPTGLATTLYAGWSNDPTALAHLRLTIDSVTIDNPLKPATPVVRPAPGWVLQAAVDGEFQRLVGLDDVRAGDVVPQSIAFDEYLPANGELHLTVEGKSRKCIDTMFGQSLRTSAHALGLSAMITCLETTNDPNDPGLVDVTHAGPDFGATGAARSVDGMGSSGGACAQDGVLCLTDADCGMGDTCKGGGAAYSIEYRVERLP